MKSLEERIFVNWLRKNKLVGNIGKGRKGMVVPMSFVFDEYAHVGGGMYLSERVYERVLRDYQISAFKQ